MAVVEQVSCQDSRTTRYYESTIILVFTTAEKQQCKPKKHCYLCVFWHKPNKVQSAIINNYKNCCSQGLYLNKYHT